MVADHFKMATIQWEMESNIYTRQIKEKYPSKYALWYGTHHHEDKNPNTNTNTTLKPNSQWASDRVRILDTRTRTMNDFRGVLVVLIGSIRSTIYSSRSS